MLSPFEEFPAKRWGQLNELVFFPLPWDLKLFHRKSLLGKEYDLVWSNSGIMRAVVTLKSAPMTIQYTGEPYFQPKELEVKCHLYRVIYVYPDKPFYTEELLVLDERGFSINFRPYYLSLVHNPHGVYSELKRFEHIPDYFVSWKSFAGQNRGYGFAADAHIRRIQLNGDEIRWRLPLTHHNKCIHYFMFQSFAQFDPFHIIGHSGWYERVFKPLRVIPLPSIGLSPFTSSV